MRVIVLASILACLPLAAEEATCPLCGKKVAAFEDSPQGAVRKFQFAVLTRDEALLREVVHDLQDNDRREFLGHDPLVWSLAGLQVVDCQVDGDRATLTLEMAGDGKPRDVVAVRVDGMWRLDFRARRAAAQGVVAQAMLKQLVSTEGVWRMTDSDRNGVQDYWTQDVAGFYYAKDASGVALKYIDVAMANADRSGLTAWSNEPAAPKSGYWVEVLRTDEEGRPYAHDGDGDGVANTSTSKFAFCAYPASYMKGTTLTYIVNEEGVVYEKDLGPEAKGGIDAWPGGDPMTQGWKACE